MALPGQLFYSTPIPACLWFLSRERGGGRFRDRAGEILFIDARALGRMVDRTHRELTDEDIARIADTYHAWRGEEGAGTRTPTSPASARARRWRRSASTAMCSPPAAMSARHRRRTTASPSRTR